MVNGSGTIGMFLWGCSYSGYVVDCLAALDPTIAHSFFFQEEQEMH